MKEVTIIISILIIVFGSAYLIQSFLNKGTDELVGELENLKKEIKNQNFQKKDLELKADKVYENWEDINEKWSTIVLHSEMDLIDTSLIKMKSKIKIGKIDESMEDIDTSIFLLKHIKEKEKTSLKNIF